MAESPLNFRESLSNQFLPEFKNPALELSYRQHNVRLKQMWMRIGSFIGAVMFLAIEPLAQLQLPQEVHALDHAARWYLQAPTLLMVFFVTFTTNNDKLIELAVIVALCVALLSTTGLLWVSGLQGRDFYSTALVQIMVFGFFVFGMRFKPAFLCISIFFVLNFYILSTFEQQATSLAGRALLNIGIMIMFAGAAFAAYSVDISARTAFLSTRALNREYDERLVLQSERNKWLQVISDFLRHELKNSLVGVTSSLELIKRRNSNPDLENYIDRAENSSRFMKRLLDEASASTSLESSLDNIQLERCNLFALVEDKLDEYREMYPENHFQFNGDKPVQVTCDVDRIVQVLDKLINNAVEHGDSSYPIVISLNEAENSIRLSVADIGDSLASSDELDIFEPFVSRKSRLSDGNMGFGLYVVKRIIEAHGGTVTARSLSNPAGAEFILSLPASILHPAVASAPLGFNTVK